MSLLQLFRYTVVTTAMTAMIMFTDNIAASKTCTKSNIDDYLKKIEIGKINDLNEAATCDETAVDYYLIILDSQSQTIKGNAAYTLGAMGKKAKLAIPKLLIILNNKSNSPNTRLQSADALGTIGSEAKQEIKPYLSDMRFILKNLKDDSEVRAAVAGALGTITLEPDETIPILAEALDDIDPRVKMYAAIALAKFGIKAKDHIPNLIKLLQEQDVDVSIAVAHVLNNITTDLSDKAKTLQEVELALEKAIYIQKIYDDPTFISNANIKIKEKIKATSQRTIDALRNKKSTLYMDIAQEWVMKISISHILFWLTLIFFYPKYSIIQAFFFWNPTIREIIGFWYVSPLLISAPFLRHRLFAPFRDSLLDDAGLESFDPQLYFSDCTVKIRDKQGRLNWQEQEEKPLRSLLPELKGRIVLEGASGLGKTVFLLHLLKESSHLAVYLPAHRCDQGVIEAIQAKLHGQTQDADFLKQLIYAGAIDIYIDGLNEVSAETRAKITNFVESYSKGNIILTTQPLEEWNPPGKIYVLQPLKQEQIKQFLLLRQLDLPKDAPVQGDDYIKNCDVYLNKALNAPQSPEELKITRQILSNPFDLTIVSQVIALGKQPDLFQLQEQQYKLMNEDYQRVNVNQPFPLEKFSEAVYQMRLKDERTLSDKEFHQELLCMKRFRMVISTEVQDSDGKLERRWRFRHDKIMEFFIVQTFLGVGNDRLTKHFREPPFRGVYLILALLLPEASVMELREQLIQDAAQTKDHTLSDLVIQLINSRQFGVS